MTTTSLTLGGSVDISTLGLPSLAYNVEKPSYYKEPRFINWARNGQLKNFDNSFPTASDLTVDGYYKKIPDGQTNCSLIFRSAVLPRAYLDGNITITWEGDGDIEINGAGATNGAITSGDVIAYTDTGLTKLIFTRINEADPIRNIEIVHEDNATDYAAGKIFIQSTLAVAADTGGARFMMFLDTNNVTDGDWANRVTENWFVQSPEVSIENCITFANEAYALNPKFTNAWFCVPHLATVEYMTEFARLMRDSLNPNITAVYELSNEMWNTQFDQADWCVDQSIAVWGSVVYHDRFSWQAKMACQLAQIVAAEYGSNTNYKRVLAFQATASPAQAVELTDAPAWLANEPENWVDPKTVHEVWSITTYFSNGLGDDAGIATDYEANGEASALAYMNALVPAGLATSSVNYGEHFGVAEAAGLELVAYEGGHHVIPTADNLYVSEDGNGDLKSWVLDLFHSFTYSAEMAVFQNTNRDNWKDAGGHMIYEFSDFYKATQSGSWGRFEYLGDPNPIGASIATWQTANPKWWLG